MENPYPRRNELPTAERVNISGFDKNKHAAIRKLGELSEQAAEVFNPDQLYDEPTYLGDYIEELNPVSVEDTPQAEDLKVRTYEQADALIMAQKARDLAVAALPELSRGLFMPVRDFTDARKIKQGNMPGAAHYDPTQPESGDYREVEIQPSDEPFVSLHDYNIHSRSYYSRPNGMSGDPVPGLKPDVYVRRSIAEKLITLNDILKSPEITAFFGGEVELFVDEGYRDPEIQRYLFEDGGPKNIMKHLAEDHGIDQQTATKQQLDQLKKEMIAIRNKRIGRPTKFGEGSPGPHQTGAAVDMTIRYKQNTTELVPRVNIWFGKSPTSLVKVNDPDHFEHTLPTSHEELVAQQNLRAWHHLLNLAGLKQNPTEFWHTGDGDQLSAILDGDVHTVTARYGWPAQNPETYTAPHSNEAEA